MIPQKIAYVAMHRMSAALREQLSSSASRTRAAMPFFVGPESGCRRRRPRPRVAISMISRDPTSTLAVS